MEIETKEIYFTRDIFLIYFSCTSYRHDDDAADGREI